MYSTTEKGHSHSIKDGEEYTEMADGHRHKIWPSCRKCAKVRKWLFNKTGQGFTEEALGHRHQIKE